MSEWSNVPAWKASIPQGIGGSNPLLSAKGIQNRTLISDTFFFCNQLNYVLNSNISSVICFGGQIR